MDHTQELERALDAKFRHLVMHKTLSFEFRPWGPNQHFGPYGCASCPDLTKSKELPFMSLFHYAAQAGHWSLMEGLVTEYCQHEGLSDETLLIACRHGQVWVVRNLMGRIKFDTSFERAVNAATAAGHVDVFEYLMNWAEDSHYSIIGNASSLLTLAAKNGHEKMLDVIFTYFRRMDDEYSEDSVYINKHDELTGGNLFFLAVMSGHANIVRNLLARGGKIKAHGNTAIHIAAEYGQQDILRILLKAAVKGIDSDNDTKGNHVSGYVAGEKLDLLHLLRSFDSEGETPLHKAARNGHSAVMGLMLKHDTLLELKTQHVPIKGNYEYPQSGEGYAALHLAARGGHLDVLKILKDNGAWIEAGTDVRGWRALHLAAAEGHEAVVRWLLQKGAQSREEAKDGAEALQLAVSGGHDGVVRALLDPGNAFNVYEIVASIETAARDGQAPVLRAFFERFPATYYVKRALRVAEREKQGRAADLARSFLEFRT